jgi:hypothetical protein
VFWKDGSIHQKYIKLFLPIKKCILFSECWFYGSFIILNFSKCQVLCFSTASGLTLLFPYRLIYVCLPVKLCLLFTICFQQCPFFEFQFRYVTKVLHEIYVIVLFQMSQMTIQQCFNLKIWHLQFYLH